MKSVIDIKNLSVYYGNVCALENINLSIGSKDFIAIIGPNGGGKSTLLKTILGIVKPSSGSIEVLGNKPAQSCASLGYVPQYTNFDRDFPISVEDVVMMGRLKEQFKPFHSFYKKDRSIVQQAMQRLSVYELRNRRIGSLSGGQMQKVLISRALAVEPDILLLDEPTSNIDTTSRIDIYEMLKELNSEITIVIVTHDTGSVSSYVKSIGCLNETLHYHGSPELDKTTVEKVYGCPIELIAHGVPHRVLHDHQEETKT